jgi:hypothetical protein
MAGLFIARKKSRVFFVFKSFRLVLEEHSTVSGPY